MAIVAASDRPDHAMVVEDGVQRHIVGFGFEVRQEIGAKAQSDGEGAWLQAGQGAVVKAAAVAQTVAAGRVTHAGNEQQGGVDDLGVLGLGNAVGIVFHRAARVPGMKAQGFLNFVHHRQSNFAQLGLLDQFAVLFPAVQCRQRVEFSLDRPVGANHGIRTAQQPDAHDLLQVLDANMSIGQPLTQFNQTFAQGFLLECSFFVRVIHNLTMQFRTILTSIGLLGALCCASLTACAAPSRGGAADDAVLEMNQAFKNGQNRRLTELLPRVRGHVLEPWAAYWELRARLDTASTDDIQAFLHRYRGTYQEDRLRNDWLLQLGQRRDWSVFAQQVALYRMNDDREVRCYTLAMELLQKGSDGASELRPIWYAQKEAGPACLLAAQLHFEQQKLSPADIWREVRLSVETRQLKAARQALEIVAPQSGAALTDLLAKPEPFLVQRLLDDDPQSLELAVLALIRLADTDHERAARLLENGWAQKLDPAQLAWVWGAIGQEAAQALSPRAVTFFSRGNPEGMHDEQLAWRARAALRQGQWAEVLAAVQAMSPRASADPAWVYWRARALLALDPSQAQQQQARQWLQSVAGVRGFYELLAQEELGLSITPPPEPEPLSAAEKHAARANPGLQRALAAIALGLRSEGVKEWNYHTNLHQPGGMGDRELLAAADLACQHEVWDRCINTSERTRSVIDLKQRFPMPHRQAVLERSAEIGLDPAYVYGLIRQESRFVTDARSGVGASGLMQVMPTTARWTAKKIGLTDFKPHQLTERDTNIAIGTGYLKLVLDDFAGSMPMAAAAYNAGPGRPRSWRGQAGAPVLEAAIWAENVPFAETRDYVKKVLANTTIYAAMISGQTQSLKARLGRIGPRQAGALENADLP